MWPAVRSQAGNTSSSCCARRISHIGGGRERDRTSHSFTASYALCNLQPSSCRAHRSVVENCIATATTLAFKHAMRCCSLNSLLSGLQQRVAIVKLAKRKNFGKNAQRRPLAGATIAPHLTPREYPRDGLNGHDRLRTRRTTLEGAKSSPAMWLAQAARAKFFS